MSRYTVSIDFTIEAEDEDEALDLIENILADSGVGEQIEQWDAHRAEQERV